MSCADDASQIWGDNQRLSRYGASRNASFHPLTATTGWGWWDENFPSNCG